MKVKAVVECIAVYHTDIDVPDGLTDKKIIDYIRDNINDLEAHDLEFVEDMEDPNIIIESKGE